MRNKVTTERRKKKEERVECINHYTNRGRERERHYNTNRRQRKKEIRMWKVQPCHNTLS